MIAILTIPAISSITLFWALKVCKNTIFFLQIYVRFVPEPMGSDAKNILTSKKKKCNLIALIISARLMHFTLHRVRDRVVYAISYDMVRMFNIVKCFTQNKFFNKLFALNR